MVINFEDLQELSGCRQQTKVIEWLEDSQIRYFLGRDGKPRTTHQFLELWHDGSKSTTEVRFKNKKRV